MSWPEWKELLDLWDAIDARDLISQLSHCHTSPSSSLIQLLEATNVLLSGCPPGPMPADICEAAVASGAPVLLVQLVCGLSSICFDQQSKAEGLLQTLWTHAVTVLESISKAASLAETGPVRRYIRLFIQAPVSQNPCSRIPVKGHMQPPATLNHPQQIFAMQRALASPTDSGSIQASEHLQAYFLTLLTWL